MKKMMVAGLLALTLSACAPREGAEVQSGGASPSTAPVAQGTPMLHDEKHLGSDGMPVPNPTPAVVAQETPSPAPTLPYDAMFLDMMVNHHQQAVDMANEVLEGGSDENVKALARKIQADQEKEIAQMEAWRQQWYADQPRMSAVQIGEHMEMDMPHGPSVDALDPDHRFLVQMIPHHEGAVLMSHEALEKAEHPELKQMAQTIIDEQQKEIAQMQKMLDGQESAER